MSRKILNHLKKADPILYKIVCKLGEIKPYEIRSSGDFFSDLCESIVGQQLSGKAADAIWKRLLDLFPNKKPKADKILKMSDDQMRSSGLSFAKIRSLKDLSSKVQNKEINLDALDSMEDKEVISQLIRVKGIGPWTAEMFLMFTLGRPDIFSHGDLALVKAIKNIYFKGNPPAVGPTRIEIEEIVCKWSPYKSYACRVLWRSLENTNT